MPRLYFSIDLQNLIMLDAILKEEMADLGTMLKQQG